MLQESQFQWTADAGLNAIAERTVINHRPLAHKRAHAYARRYDLSFEDLCDAAYCGLMRAATRFDPERGFTFGTYARYWVDHELREAARISRDAVKRPRQLTADEKDQDGPDSSLNTPIGEDGDAELGDLIGCDPFGTTLDASGARRVSDGAACQNVAEDILIERLDAGAEVSRRHKLLRDAIAPLTDRERAIVEARHGDDEPLTLADLAKRFSVSVERIRQIETAALEKVRRCVRNAATDRRPLSRYERKIDGLTWARDPNDNAARGAVFGAFSLSPTTSEAFDRRMEVRS